jgi:putative PIN family toxin of toxin-antitoxin system
VQAVLDPNVIISGLLSSGGPPAEVLRAFDRGDFEVIVSPGLLSELARALAYAKLRRHVGRQDADAVVQWVSESARTVGDGQATPPARSVDPGDDYLIALASSQRAALVSGDKHLLDLASKIPVFSPREFLRLLAEH